MYQGSQGAAENHVQGLHEVAVPLGLFIRPSTCPRPDML